MKDYYVEDYIEDYSYDDYLKEFYHCEIVEEELTDLQYDGIDCSEEFMEYLKENVKILDLYCGLALDKYDVLKLPERTVKISQKKITNSLNDEIYYEPRIGLPDVKMYCGYKFHFSSCPFHYGSTFFIDDKENLYYCYGCGATGNIFHFVCDVFNINLRDATMIIAEIANLTIPEEEKPSFFDEQFLLLQPKGLILPRIFPLIRGFRDANAAHTLRQKANEKYQKLLNRIDRYILNQFKLGIIDEVIFVDEYKIEKMCDRLCIYDNKKLFQQRIRRFFNSEEYKKICNSIEAYIALLIKNNNIDEYIFYDEQKMISLSKKIGIGKKLFERKLGEFYNYRYQIYMDDKINDVIQNYKLNRFSYPSEICKAVNLEGVDYHILKERLYSEKSYFLSPPERWYD